LNDETNDQVHGMTEKEAVAIALLSDETHSASALAADLANKLWPDEMASDETPHRRRQNLLLAANGIFAKMRTKGLCEGDSATGYRMTEKGRNAKIMQTRPNTDRTAVQRNARLKERLVAGGGVRMSINLDGERVKKLDAIVESGDAETRSDAIRRLIDKGAQSESQS
jgi:hypothetical protein